MTIWIISDTHFGHANIIRYCNRPFSSVEEMNEIMVQRWNEVVRPEDHVYHLGDFATGQANVHAFGRRLFGHKRLILGNHDHTAPIKDYAQYFQKILMWRLFKPFILTHAPLHPQSFGKATINVHGHIHEKPAYSDLYRNVSVEWTDYRPIALEELGSFSC